MASEIRTLMDPSGMLCEKKKKKKKKNPKGHGSMLEEM